MDVTLWGEHCHVEGQELSTLCYEYAHPVLAIKRGRVAEFNGKTVGTTSKSIAIINPDIPKITNSPNGLINRASILHPHP